MGFGGIRKDKNGHIKKLFNLFLKEICLSVLGIHVATIIILVSLVTYPKKNSSNIYFCSLL